MNENFEKKGTICTIHLELRICRFGFQPHVVLPSYALNEKRHWLRLYRIAFASARKSYRMSFLLSCANGVFGAISVTWSKAAAAQTAKVESQISNTLAWENSRHLATLPLVSPPNDVWETSAEIPYWWRVTTQILVVLLIRWIKFPTRHD